jgi:hypothetical protein
VSVNHREMRTAGIKIPPWVGIAIALLSRDNRRPLHPQVRRRLIDPPGSVPGLRIQLLLRAMLGTRWDAASPSTPHQCRVMRMVQEHSVDAR